MLEPEEAGADHAIGQFRGRSRTKVHAIVDALGNPIGLHLSGGEAHDLVGADHLLPRLNAAQFIADKAYDADEHGIAPLVATDSSVVIPSTANRKITRGSDRERFKLRHATAKFFASIKQFRPIATRYDKPARNFLAAIHLTAGAIWLS